MENRSESPPIEGTLTVGFSLRNKLLILLLGLTFFVFVAVAYLSLTTIQNMGQSAQNSSGEALSAQAEAYLSELVISNARENDLILEKVRTDAENVAQYATFIFSNPDALTPEAHWKPEDYMYLGEAGQFINTLDDTSSVLIPNSVDVDDVVMERLTLASYLDPIFASVFESDPNTGLIYIISKPDITRLYPNIGLGEIIPPEYVPTEDIFYTSGTPENNPTRETVWTPVYDDPAGQGLLVSTIAPIYLENDEFLGVIGIDVSLDNLSANLGDNTQIEGAYSFLIDSDGRAITLPEQGYKDILGHDSIAGEFGPDLNNATSNFVPILNEMKDGETGFSKIKMANGRELFVAYAPLESTGWSLGTVIEADAVLQGVSVLQQNIADETTSLIIQRLIPTAILILILVFVIGLFLTNRLVDPLRQLAIAAQQIGAQQWDTPVPPAGNDEVGLLSRTIKAMARQLSGLFDTLEEKVSDRTHQLEVVATLSSRLNAILNVDQLLSELVIQVQNNFAYYHTQIYVLDEEDEKFVLAAATGEAGKKMIQERYSIPLSASVSLVARAARRSEVVSIENVYEIEDWLPNENLPDTRSEMAVPIIREGKVVGVLDVQEDTVGGLDEGDANLLRSLTGHIAIAITNAQLYDTQIRLAEDLRQADQTKTKFLASMSHELRTPLNAIMNFTEMVALGMMGPVNDEQKDLLDQSLNSSQHLLNLINDVLDISKIQAGKLNLFIEDDVNLYEELDTVIHMVEPLVQNTSVMLIQDVANDLPLISGDKRRIRQIMLNLLSNAVKFTDEGKITFQVKQQDNQILFSVMDTGTGISEEMQSLIFQPFVQTPDGVKHADGTGLGMPITKNLVEAHGGEIWVKSTIGEGSTFFVSLPKHQKNNADE